MIFSSPVFILAFLPAVIAGVWLLGRLAGPRAQIVFLVLASWIFYGSWDWRLLPLLLGSVAVNFFFGLELAERRSKPVLWAGLAFNLGLLAWFKYAGFLTGNINMVFNTAWDAGALALPLGISFFTFQQITYLIDSYRGLVRENGPVRYALFVTFFPQLISGPLLHHSEMLPQFNERVWRGLNKADFSIGVLIFIIGFLKKTVIADPMALHVNPIYTAFAAGDPVNALTAWVAAAGFGMQLYFDFSAYSDMAIGLARMFGVRIPDNFLSPYKSPSFIEFWNRWHITLSRLLRNYAYIPLCRRWRSAAWRYINLVIVMALCGLWHGAAWTFIIWGVIHGVYLILNYGWRYLRGRKGGAVHPVEKALGVFTVFTACMATAPFIRAESLDAALLMTECLFGLHNAALTAQPGPGLPAQIAVLIAFVMLAPNTRQIADAAEAAPEKAAQWKAPPALMRPLIFAKTYQQFWLAPVAGGTMLLGLFFAFIEKGGAAPFIYFVF